MPAYDYRCLDCDAYFEVTRQLGDKTHVSCPECGGPTKRVFAPVGVVFKGSGFHNTDYRSKKHKEEPSPAGKGSCPNTGDSSACSSCPAASD
jgi:putative FmdB family regulatory protein